MTTFLRGMWANEPVRLVLWVLLGTASGALVTKGLITDDVSTALMEVLALLVFGFPAGEFARNQVTPAGHLPGVPISTATEQVRDQVGEQFGQPGLDILNQVETAVRNMQRPGRHAE